MNQEAESILRQWDQDINKCLQNMLHVQLKMGLFFFHKDDNQFLKTVKRRILYAVSNL